MIDYITVNAGLIGLVFFFAFFVIAVSWTFRPSAKNSYKEQALIPLEENNND